jgi:hypothetical protein
MLPSNHIFWDRLEAKSAGLPLPMILWRIRMIHARQAADREVMLLPASNAM